MRKIAAHYCLLPDGSLAKMPVISVDENSVIREIVVFGDGFLEKQGVELFGGLLIPGFIEDLRDVDFGNDASFLSKGINRLYAKGSLKYLCNSDRKVFPVNFRGDIFYESPIKAMGNLKEFSNESAWEEIKRSNVEEGRGLFELIHSYFKNMRSAMPGELKWGVIEQGANPGLVLLKGLDYNNMQIRETSTVKIIIS